MPRKGQNHTEEWKQMMRLKMKGRTSPFKGVVRSEDVKQKISTAKIGVALTPEEREKRNKEIHKKWWQSHPEAMAAIQKRSINNNRDKYNARRRKKWAENANHRLAEAMRHRVYKALNGIAKSKRTLNLLGCTLAEFRSYIEFKFEVGMTWDNYRYEGWHIDHIIPCSRFDLTKSKEQARCFHYTNLQPLWKRDNQRKGSKL